MDSFSDTDIIQDVLKELDSLEKSGHFTVLGLHYEVQGVHTVIVHI